jgi:hypothetical protein
MERFSNALSQSEDESNVPSGGEASRRPPLTEFADYYFAHPGEGSYENSAAKQTQSPILFSSD